MFFNYIKLSLRNIAQSRVSSIIHISGLALGIGCVLLIFCVITYHLSFDNFHTQADRIYRFVTEQHRDQISYARAVPPAFVKAFREDYAFGEKVARICNLSDQLITIEQNCNAAKFAETIAFAEPEFFDIFNFPLLEGDGSSLMKEPNMALISERVAKRFFGDESPVDKIIRFNNQIDFRIKGILKNIPDNTDLRSEIFFSYINIKEYNPWYDADDAWGGITSDIQSFVRLQPGVQPAEVESVLPLYVKKYRAESKNVHHYKLQPLDEMHFDTRYGGTMPKTILWVLSCIGFFLIFTACLNFINLATAQAVNRSKEVGVRKTLGSARSQLFWQFTLETAMIVVAATLVGLAIAYSALPYLNEWFSSRVTLDIFSDIRVALFTFALIVVVTFLSTFYPGLVLSAFKPIEALSRKMSNQNRGAFNLRRILITTQFVISQVLLIGLIVFIYQMSYFTQTDPGFDKEGVVMIPVGSNDERMKTLRAQLSQIPEVENVTLCFAAPASTNHWGTMFNYDNRVEAETFSISFRGADENYLSTFDIDLVAGRNLTPSDTVREFLVNEMFVKYLGHLSTDEVLGKTMSLMGGEWKGPIVGVVKDFHDESFRSPISPIFISTSIEHYNTYAVRINMKDATGTLDALEKAWSTMYPEQMYEYAFLDDEIAEFYQMEQTLLKLIQVFAGIALFIGCMGLYGLVSFMSVQKTKEIGIRKVLGGSVSQILWIFGKEFTRLILVSFLLAAPLGWWLMSNWLETYEYQVDLTMWIFLLELSVIFLIVLLTVGYESLRSALRNPVSSLRTE